MTTLIPYQAGYADQTLSRICKFFGYHLSLFSADVDAQKIEAENKDTLDDWVKEPNRLFVIMEDEMDVGFLRLRFRGDIAAWIEDIYVDEELRGRGIASRSINEAERIVRDVPGYEAVCIDVVPRNADALRLYHKLGYLDLSIITLRKELYAPKRDQPVNLLGMEFRI